MKTLFTCAAILISVLCNAQTEIYNALPMIEIDYERVCGTAKEIDPKKIQIDTCSVQKGVFIIDDDHVVHEGSIYAITKQTFDPKEGILIHANSVEKNKTLVISSDHVAGGSLRIDVKDRERLTMLGRAYYQIKCITYQSHKFCFSTTN